jgi:4-diphosphocytidyl-2-C-methyl-D-erythritol kinase
VILKAFAPAKINLFLHVGPADADGYHPLCSWMSFADIGDRLVYEPADGRSLTVEGPFAGELAGTAAADNLVMRAADRLLGADGPGFRLTLYKALPVASGLGGGSSDAGAALRLLRQALALPADDAALEAAAASIGADGPACLWGRPVLAEGRGERLSPAPAAPVLDAVLVNPGVACPTGAVYRAYDAGPPASADRPILSGRFEEVGAVAEALVACRNDLEVPAAALQPQIGRTLALLREAPEALLARLSGSGATCFALCADAKAAERLAGEVAAAEPRWWVRACRLGAP